MWYDSYTGERMASGSLRVFGHVNDAGRFLLDQGVPQAGIPLGRLGDSPWAAGGFPRAGAHGRQGFPLGGGFYAPPITWQY